MGLQEPARQQRAGSGTLHQEAEVSQGLGRYPEVDHLGAKRAATGVVLMSISMVTIPVVDAIAKYLSSTHSPLYISWARYVAACLVVIPVAVTRFGSQFLPREQIGAHLLRTVFLVSAMTVYFLAIARIPLATAISAYFVAPIIAMVLAVVFLR